MKTIACVFVTILSVASTLPLESKYNGVKGSRAIPRQFIFPREPSSTISTIEVADQQGSEDDIKIVPSIVEISNEPSTTEKILTDMGYAPTVQQTEDNINTDQVEQEQKTSQNEDKIDTDQMEQTDSEQETAQNEDKINTDQLEQSGPEQKPLQNEDRTDTDQMEAAASDQETVRSKDEGDCCADKKPYGRPHDHAHTEDEQDDDMDKHDDQDEMQSSDSEDSYVVVIAETSTAIAEDYMPETRDEIPVEEDIQYNEGMPEISRELKPPREDSPWTVFRPIDRDMEDKVNPTEENDEEVAKVDHPKKTVGEKRFVKGVRIYPKWRIY